MWFLSMLSISCILAFVCLTLSSPLPSNILDTDILSLPTDSELGKFCTIRPPPAFCMTSLHTIVPGDTLSSLISPCMTPVGRLVGLNSGVDLKNLQPGDKIKLPCTPSEPHPSEPRIATRRSPDLKLVPSTTPKHGSAALLTRANAPNTYTIAPGDTLYQLAQSCGSTADDLIKMNGNIDPAKLEVGHVIQTPCAISKTNTASVATASPTVAAAAAAILSTATAITTSIVGTKSETHVLKAGDTMWSLAQACGVDTKAVLDLNPGLVPEKLIPGVKISLPCQV